MVNSFGDTETISLNQLPAANYYIEVSGYDGAANPDYALTIDAPGSASLDWVNQTAPNGEQSKAYSLGTVSGPVSLPSLSIQTDTSEEWFSFAIGTPRWAGRLGRHQLRPVARPARPGAVQHVQQHCNRFLVNHRRQ